MFLLYTNDPEVVLKKRFINNGKVPCYVSVLQGGTPHEIRPIYQTSLMKYASRNNVTHIYPARLYFFKPAHPTKGAISAINNLKLDEWKHGYLQLTKLPTLYHYDSKLISTDIPVCSWWPAPNEH